LARQQQHHQPHHPAYRKGHNNRRIGEATAVRQGNRIILHTKQLRFKQQWQGNSGTLTYGMATTTAALAGQQRLHCKQQCYNNRSIGTATAFDSPTHGNRISCQSQGKDQ